MHDIKAIAMKYAVLTNRLVDPNSASEAKLTNRREKFKNICDVKKIENVLEMPQAYLRPTTLMGINNC